MMVNGSHPAHFKRLPGKVTVDSDRPEAGVDQPQTGYMLESRLRLRLLPGRTLHTTADVVANAEFTIGRRIYLHCSFNRG